MSSHTVKAQVDDSKVITESNKTNNTISKPFSIQLALHRAVRSPAGQVKARNAVVAQADLR